MKKSGLVLMAGIFIAILAVIVTCSKPADNLSFDKARPLFNKNDCKTSLSAGQIHSKF